MQTNILHCLLDTNRECQLSLSNMFTSQDIPIVISRTRVHAVQFGQRCGRYGHRARD